MFDTLHPDEIEDILFSHHVGHLACISCGAPYVVPITYAYAGGDLYGMTQPGRKVTAMRENPAVAFSIVDLTNPRRWRSVIVEGTYTEVEDVREREPSRCWQISARRFASRTAALFSVSPLRGEAAGGCARPDTIESSGPPQHYSGPCDRRDRGTTLASLHVTLSVM